MVIPHIKLDGTLAACEDPGSCELEFHLPELSESEVETYPTEVLRHMVLQLQLSSSEEEGFRFWRDGRGSLHRDYDLPAITWRSQFGPKMDKWLQHGKIHRDHDLPAEVWGSGLQVWFQHGKRHREGDQPASINNVEQIWYRRGRKHRGGGMPAVTSKGATLISEYWYFGVKLPGPLAGLGLHLGLLKPGVEF